MILYETRKLVQSRVLAVLGLALLGISFALTFALTAKAPEESFTKSLETLCDKANADEDAFAVFEKDLREENRKLVSDYVHAGHTEGVENVYTKKIDGVHRDIDLLDAVSEIAKQKDAYLDAVDILYSQALREKAELERKGVSHDDYLYRYEEEVQERYAAVFARTDYSLAPSFGWSDLFENDYSPFFLFVLILCASSLLFVSEKGCGMLPLVRSTKKGRAHTAISKIAALWLLTAAVVLLFEGGTLLAVFWKGGLSNPNAPIQSLSLFSAFPYTATILEYYLFSLSAKILSLCLFGTLVLFLSLLFYNVLLSFLSGMALFLLQVLCSTLDLANFSFLKTLNLLSVSLGRQIGARFFALNFFGRPLSYQHLILPLYILLALTSATGTIFLYVRGTTGVKPALQAKIVNKLRALFSRGRSKKHGRYSIYSLFRWENKKLLFSSFAFVFLLLLLGVQAFWGVKEYRAFAPDYSYRAYLSYFHKDFAGPYTEEKYERINEMKAERSALETKRQLLQMGILDIPPEEAEQFSKDIEKLDKTANAFLLLSSRAEYLKEQKEKTGIDGWFLRYENDEGLLRDGFVLPTMLAVILCGTLIFTREYGVRKNENFSQLLRTTKKGRRKTFAAKTAVMLFLAFAVSALFCVVELIFRIQTYGFFTEDLAAPLFSLQRFSAFGSSLSVGGYLLLTAALRIVCSLLLSLVSLSFSALLQSVLPSISLSTLLAFFPALLFSFGLFSARFVSLYDLMSGAYLHLSADTDFFSNDFGLLMLAAAICLSLTVELYIIVRRKFLK